MYVWLIFFFLSDRPESTGVATPTSTFTPPTSRSSLIFGATSGTGLPASTNVPQASSGSNAGAIAGGVIGGVVGLALIGGLVFFFLRRRRSASEKPASSAFNTTPYMATPYNPDPNMSYNAPPSASPFTSAQQRFYVCFSLNNNPTNHI